MKSALRIWVPFGELLHHETEVGGWYWRRGSGKPKWWAERAEVLRKFTLPSLCRLAHGKSIWAGIPEESKGIAKPVLDVLKDFKAIPIFHPARDSEKYGKGPAREAVFEFLERHDAEAITFLCVDSDDMYLKSARKHIELKDVSPGLIQLFRAGYIYNSATGEMCTYTPGSCPPPFFAKTYARDYLDDPDGYEERWNFCLPHNRFRECANRVDLPGGQFVVVVHEKNTTSMWKNPKIAAKIGPLLDEASRDSILRRCGHVG
ncbi:MAG: hypothetical protein JRL30_01070 [Deltaproteobacteria bacterium]|nr:hypothetical protein [Deltaproteobacteria bacterium]